MKPIFKEEIKSNQVLLHPNSLISHHQFPSNNDILCISLNNFFQKFYLSCVLNDDLDKSVIALPKWLSLTCDNLDIVNVQLVDTSSNYCQLPFNFLFNLF